MKQRIITAVIALAAASPVLAQRSAMQVPRTAVISGTVYSPLFSELKPPSQSGRGPYALFPSRSIQGIPTAVVLPSVIVQAEQERYNLKWPLIGAVLGAAAGYWYAERHEVLDAHFPAHITAVPVGALAGFVVGIVTEHIIVTVGNSEARR